MTPTNHEAIVASGYVTAAGCALLLLAAACASGVRSGSERQPRFINPATLVKPSGYTHVVVAPDGRTVYVAGQIALDSTGALIGAGDFRAQAERTYANVRRAVESVGGTMADVIKTTTFVVDIAANSASLREIRTRYLDPVHPPTNTLVPVPALGRPDLLIEIEAVAVLRAPMRP